ncbi:MAG: hypothetical protein HFJ43_06305 [Clostridia bacterium]|nr:hypothetical protein [Clostridia bacterium]
MDNSKEKTLSSGEELNYTILIKLKNFFTNLFSKKLYLPEKTITIDEKEVAFMEKYANKTIEEIQVLYEEGELEEEELPNSKLEELKELYVNQILRLDKDSIKYTSPF